MGKWVKTVIPYERREQRNCQTCHSLLHSKERTEDSKDGEERRRGGEGREAQSDRETRTERRRENPRNRRKRERKLRGRGMKQKGGDFEAREEGGGEREDQ